MDDETADGDDESVEAPADSTGAPEDDAGLDPAAVPDAATENHWKQLIVEMEQSAEEHRKAGWRTAVLHPTASGVLDEGEPGIGVVVRREEFDGLDELVSVREIDEYEVLRADLPGEIQLLTILYSADGDVAVFVPSAVEADRLDGLRAAVDGTFYTHVTPPADDATITFRHDDPTLFFPGTERPRTAQTREGTPGTSDQSVVDLDEEES